MIVDMWLQACAFDIVLPQHIHNYLKKNMRRWRQRAWSVFCWGAQIVVYGSTRCLWQMQNTQNLSSFTIVIVFIVFIRYCDSWKFPYRQALACACKYIDVPVLMISNCTYVYRITTLLVLSIAYPIHDTDVFIKPWRSRR